MRFIGKHEGRKSRGFDVFLCWDVVFMKKCYL
jgi:hypothetical protein